MNATDVMAWPVLARWAVAADHPALAGHFPAQPVVPGALLLDWAVGAIGKLAGQRVGTIRDARFSGMVRPGQTVELRALIEASAARFAVLAEPEGAAQIAVSGVLNLIPHGPRT